MASDADRAAVLRHRWRADLRALNGDTFGAETQRHLADVSETYQITKDAWLEADRPNSGVIHDGYRAALADLDAVRVFFRAQVQNAAARTATVAPESIRMNFTEPSDDELLAGAK